jgi:hypothetical protein
MKIGLITLCLLTVVVARAQQTVPDSVMQQVYEDVKTPYKYGLVVVPADNEKKRWTVPRCSARANPGG